MAVPTPITQKPLTQGVWIPCIWALALGRAMTASSHPGPTAHRHPGAHSPSWEWENQIWEVPEWGPQKAGSGGEAAGPAGWLGPPEPRLPLRKPPMKEEGGALPIRLLPAAGRGHGQGGWAQSGVHPLGIHSPRAHTALVPHVFLV